MTEIHISVRNKIATASKRCHDIICSNSDYEVVFTFDAEWDEHNEKTARFIYGGLYTDVKFTGNRCPVPIIMNTTRCHIGVYAGNLKTTTDAIVDCRTSILDLPGSESESGQEVPPNSFQEYVENVREYAEAAQQAVKDCEDVQAEISFDMNELEVNNRNSYSNALKGFKEGEIVRVDDVSPCEHDVRVKVHGKNLLPFPYYKSSSTNAGGTFTVLDDGGISGSGMPTGYCDMYVYQGKPLADSGVVTFSMSGTCTNIVATVAIYDDAGNQLITKNWEANPVKLNLDELTSAAKWLILIKRKTDNIEMSGIAYLQIEKGNTATGYEPYLDPTGVTVTRYGVDESDNAQNYTPNADGTVDGILSLSPTMTLMTDTEGVNIEVKYNRDINKENENIHDTITEIDNVVAEHTLLLGDVETALDNIIAMQNSLIGGEA